MKVVIFVALCVAVAVAQMGPPPCGLDQATCKTFGDCMMTQLKPPSPPAAGAGAAPSAADMAAAEAAGKAAEDYCFSTLGFTEAQRTTVRNNRPQPPQGPPPQGLPTGVAATSG